MFILFYSIEYGLNTVLVLDKYFVHSFSTVLFLQVFIKDIVDVVEVDKSGLRTLQPKFMELMDGSVKCHLCGIVPPSGSKAWPHHAIEQLKILATNSSAEYFINQMDDNVSTFFVSKILLSS